MTNSSSHTEKQNYSTPPGSVTNQAIKIGGKNLVYETRAEWVLLRKEEKPVAEMFHVAYLLKDQKQEQRPLTFIFNGGPGAASAFLHIGAIGPKRIFFNENGTAPKSPVLLMDNMESWIQFSDLVFIDPVTTGFSRVITNPCCSENADKNNSSPQTEVSHDTEYYGLNSDLNSLGKFIIKFLSKHKRWDSPIYIAGESYGGFRAACMAKRLQSEFGVGLNGVVIISPVFEFITIDPTDYDMQSWLNIFPTLAIVAAFKKKKKKYSKETPINKIAKEAEIFANNEFLKFLSLGTILSKQERANIISEMSAYTGLSKEDLYKSEWRINHARFGKRLLHKERKLCGLYDASVTGIDPFPDRYNSNEPDPTLASFKRLFAAGINAHLRKNLELETERSYLLLNCKAGENWKLESSKYDFFKRQIGATDELRFGMALNPHMKVFITHGYYDLVTPYYSSIRIINQMRLDPSLKKNLVVKNYKGGHMFYTWDESRKEFSKAMKSFFKETC